MDLRALIWMAWRQIRSVRSRVIQGTRGLSFMTTMSIAGVATGVLALVVVLSVMGGFEGDLRRKMLAGKPHVEVVGENATAGFSLVEHPLHEIQRQIPEARNLQPFTETDVVLKRSRYMASATLFGVDPAKGASNWGFTDAFRSGGIESLADRDSEGRPGIALGDELAKHLDAEEGDEITVLSPQAGVGSIIGGGTLSRTFVVTGIFSTGMFNYDTKWAVTNLDEGRRFMPDFDESLTIDRFVTGVGFEVADPMAVSHLKERLSGRSGLRLLTWQEANKSLLFALKLEKFAMGSILMLIVVVAAFSISGTMMMTVFHKRPHISLLRALGMSRRDVLRLYLTHGAVIGATGVVIGLLAGLAICLFVEWSRSIPMPSDSYYLKVLPVKFLPVDYLVIVLSAFGFSLLAASYPAWLAARQDPGSGLRYE
ncbi:MAG: hypothetical protein RIQ81_2185 [Pseudomonadota bacterium]